MSDAKVEIRVGEIHFSGEGNQDWVASQLDKILAKAEELIKFVPAQVTPDSSGKTHKPMGSDPGIASKTLPSFLNEKNANKVQVKKLLATAVWLEAKGMKRIKTSDITTALKDSNQSRLGNPADCLNQNVSKGYCEKDGSDFFVTDEGKQSL